MIGEGIHVRDEDKTQEQLIAEVRELRRRLSSSEQYLDAVLANLPIGVAILEGPEFRYFRINKKLARLNGLPVEAHLGRTVMEVLPDAEDALLPSLREVSTTGTPILHREFSIELPRDPEHAVHVVDWLVPVTAPDGPSAVIAIVLDVTELKETQKLLRHSQKMEALLRRNRELVRTKAALELKNAEVEARRAEMERFTYTVSHELKSPLVTIRGFLGMAQTDAAAGSIDRLGKDLARIDTAAAAMAQLLDELLDLSRIGRVIHEQEKLSVGELAQEAVDLVHGQVTERGADVEIASDLPIVFGDRVRLLEVLQNLIGNSIKFMGDQRQPRVWVGSRQEGEETICFVRDNGIGIDPKYHGKVFGLFDRLDHDIDGTAIGLALVKRIIEVHGGRIWVESQGRGHGATFFFTLPEESPGDPAR